mgnify:CR=1 FL=1
MIAIYYTVNQIWGMFKHSCNDNIYLYIPRGSLSFFANTKKYKSVDKYQLWEWNLIIIRVSCPSTTLNCLIKRLKHNECYQPKIWATIYILRIKHYQREDCMTPTTEQVKIVRTNMTMFYIQKKYKISEC